MTGPNATGSTTPQDAQAAHAALRRRTDDRPPRRDAEAKATGRVRYCSDRPMPGLLHARLVLSPVAHALIRQIDVDSALRRRGVVAVLTAKDLPFVEEDDTRPFQPLAGEEIVFAGQPVAMVVAESEAEAEDGAAAVVLHFDPLPAVLDAEDGARPGSPLARTRLSGKRAELENVHGAIGGDPPETITDEEFSNNVCKRLVYRRGDVDAAIADCPIVLERRFEAAWVHQIPLETPVATAMIEDDGTLWVETSTQALFITREALAAAFGLTQASVRITAAPMGGSFGSKFVLVEPLVAGAALALKRPVRLAMTRTEELRAGSPAAASIMTLRLGATREGRLVGVEARLICDDGAFSELGSERLSAFCFGGPYRWDAFRVKAIGVETNRFGTGAYRAPGGPPAIFALESLIDELAAVTGRDALELRLDNLVSEGEERVDGLVWRRIGMRACLERLRDHPLWRARNELPPGEGIGVAAGVWTGARDSASAVCRMDGDGTVTIVTGIADMTGVQSTLAELAAAELDLPSDMVRVVVGDSTTAPYAPPSGGSSATYLFGPAVRAAAGEVRNQLVDLAASQLEAAPEDLELVDGRVRVRGTPTASVAVADLAAEAWSFGGSIAPIQAQGSIYTENAAPMSSANLVHVRVDPDTHETRVLTCVAAQDVGRALHPALIEAQIHGGVLQGVGRALIEQLVHDDDGVLVTDSLMTYALPWADSAPRIEVELIEEPSEEGPFGARGVGEGPVLAVPAAIANAVAAATGARLGALPMTPQRIWRARRDRDAPGEIAQPGAAFASRPV